MKQYKYITVRLNPIVGLHAGKPVYQITNNRSGDELGQIFWYASWRGWVANFREEAVWSLDCLRDVADAVEAVGKEKASA